MVKWCKLAGLLNTIVQKLENTTKKTKLNAIPSNKTKTQEMLDFSCEQPLDKNNNTNITLKWTTNKSEPFSTISFLSYFSPK